MAEIVQIITSAIATLGFPIVVSGALFWFMIKSNEQHKEEIDKLSKAVNNNTVVVQKLIDKLEPMSNKSNKKG